MNFNQNEIFSDLKLRAINDLLCWKTAPYKEKGELRVMRFIFSSLFLVPLEKRNYPVNHSEPGSQALHRW